MDQVPNCYNSYASKMPWYAVPFDAPQVAQRLVATFLNVNNNRNGIPHVVVIRPDGTLWNDKDDDDNNDVVHRIEADPEGLQFPWPAPPCHQFLPDQFCRYSMNDDDNDDDDDDDVLQYEPMSKLENKYILLYFAAHWCATCRTFGPQLNEAYQNLKQHHGDGFEVSDGVCDWYLKQSSHARRTDEILPCAMCCSSLFCMNTKHAVAIASFR